METMIRLKKLALCPDEREKVCQHDHAPYRARGGAPSCTGPLKCSMCGAEFGDHEELADARHYACIAARPRWLFVRLKTCVKLSAST